MAPKPFHLKCKTNTGQHLVNNLNDESTVQELKAIIFSLTGICQNELQILSGFPPKNLDLSNDSQKLGTILTQPMETLIIQKKKHSPVQPLAKPVTTHVNSKQAISQESPSAFSGILLRRIVPANNSCLFTSVYFCISGGNFSEESARDLRKIIAESVSKDPLYYNEAFLGKTNAQYCKWILNDEHWGGAIELSILSKHYKIEIVAIDTQNSRLNRFGEDMNYDKRILLIYDGIHYDPIMLEPLAASSSIKSVETIFPCSEKKILKMALELANEARTTHQYTDVQNFTLKCLDCNVGFKGQAAARLHAKVTGHLNFDEI